MPVQIRPCSSLEELRSALDAISHYFGFENTPEDVERFAQWIELDRMHAAWDGDAAVGGAGAFSYRMSVPGGDVAAGGVTVVGVLPTHRRRGVLTELMRAQLDDAHARGDVATFLWASEATIYGRFGYGLASRIGEMTLPRERTAFAQPFEQRGIVRLVDAVEAARLFPPLYEQVFTERPGMASRSQAWWETRRVAAPRQGGPLNRALLELDGAPAGYALYQVAQEQAGGSSNGTVTIREAVAPTAEATRELWRWLLDFDWTARFRADLLPLDHPLFLLLAEPRRMQFTINDGVWVRLVDVDAALAARSYAADAEVVLDVADAFLPENAGRRRVTRTGVERTADEADVRLDVTALGSVYLGGFTFTQLARASRLEELRPGGVERADALFATAVEPWCAEIF
jgi:predicted acetyltransferase